MKLCGTIWNFLTSRHYTETALFPVGIIKGYYNQTKNSIVKLVMASRLWLTLQEF